MCDKNTNLILKILFDRSEIISNPTCFVCLSIEYNTFERDVEKLSHRLQKEDHPEDKYQHHSTMLVQDLLWLFVPKVDQL